MRRHVVVPRLIMVMVAPKVAPGSTSSGMYQAAKAAPPTGSLGTVLPTRFAMGAAAVEAKYGQGPVGHAAGVAPAPPFYSASPEPESSPGAYVAEPAGSPST